MIRNLLLITLGFALLFPSMTFGGTPVSGPHLSVQAEANAHALTQEELLNLKPREIAARTGQKMGFFQRLAFRIVQKKMKKWPQSPRRLSVDYGRRSAMMIGISLFLIALIPLSWLLFASIQVALFLLLFVCISSAFGTYWGFKALSYGDNRVSTILALIMNLLGGGFILLVFAGTLLLFLCCP